MSKLTTAEIMDDAGHDPFSGPVLERVVPTTSAQRTLWQQAQQGPQAPAVLALSMTIREALAVDELRRAMATLCARHEALRAGLGNDGAYMFIAMHAAIPIEIVDLSALDAVGQAAALERGRALALRTPFNMTDGPLAGATLFRLAPDHHCIELVAHSLICDAWSLGTLSAELAAALGAGPRPPSPAPSFGDHTLRQLAAPSAAGRHVPATEPAPYSDNKLDEILVRAPLALAIGNSLREAATRSGKSLESVLCAIFAACAARMLNDSKPALRIADLGRRRAPTGLVGQVTAWIDIHADVQSGEQAARLMDRIADLLSNGCDIARKVDPRPPSQDIRAGALETHLPERFAAFHFVERSVEDDPSKINPAITGQVHDYPAPGCALFMSATLQGNTLRIEWMAPSGRFPGSALERWLALYGETAEAFATRPEAILSEPLTTAWGHDAPRRAVAIRKEGANRPLFLVHDGDGQHSYAWALAPHLDKDVPVHALPAVPPDEEPLRTVEGMASRLCLLMREVQPRGPYRIAGYCNGGMLAWEIASQLLGDDEDIEFLGLLDTTFQPLRAAPAPVFDARITLLQLTQFWAGRDSTSQASFKLLCERASDMDFRAVVLEARELSLLSQELDDLPLQLLERRCLHFHALTSALEGGYVCSPLPIPVDHFAATLPGGLGAPAGWRSLLPPGKLRVHPVHGTHGSIMRLPDVQAFGAVVSQSLRSAEREFLPPHERSYAPLVPLRTGHLSEIPVFCVPGAGASIASFAEFASALRGNAPVHGLQPRGLDGRLTPYSSVSACAKACLQALESECRSRPVRLVGHSFGGWVVFEAALRLHDAGRTPVSLTLIDSESPGETAPELSHVEMLLQMIDIFEQLAQRSLDLDEQQLVRLDEAGQRTLLHSRLLTAGIMPPRSSADTLGGPIRMFARCLRTPYVPSAVYHGPVQLILLRDSRKDVARDERRLTTSLSRWRQWAPNLQVWQGPGDHMTALKPPHVQALVDWLQRNSHHDI